MADAESKIIVLTKPMRHHRSRSGYNALAPYLRPDVVVRSQTSALGRVSNAVSRRLLRRWTGIEWYGVSSFWGELRAASRTWNAGATSRRPTLIHVFYGEDLLYLLPRLISPNVAVVVTFHQPVERFRRLFKSETTLKLLDGIIVLEEKNRAHFESIFPGRVHSLRLGVDTEFWSPAPSPSPISAQSPAPSSSSSSSPSSMLSGAAQRAEKLRLTEKRCIAVGNHLRDFELLGGVIERLMPEGYVFDIVSSSPKASQLPGGSSVHVHRGISDEALRDLYRKAAVSILPLSGGSASNALVQALSCGVPTCISDVGGVGSYGQGTDAVSLARPKDVEGHAAALRTLVSRGRALREEARHHGLQFAWERMAEEHRRVYDAVLQARTTTKRE